MFEEKIAEMNKNTEPVCVSQSEKRTYTID